MQGTLKSNSNLIKWKEKAIERRKKIDALTKRIKEIKTGRSNWKEKYFSSKEMNKALLSENMELKRRISVLEQASNLTSAKPKHHSYGSLLISMLIQMRQQGNCSLRACIGVMKILVLVLGLEIKIPCASSILNWEKKLGLYNLKNKKDSGTTQAIILDESISIGTEKILLTLGVDLENYTFGQALNFSDMNLLDLAIGSSWKGEEISARLEQLKQDYVIDYAITDGGTNLIKSLKDSQINRVADCTHAIGNILKRQYNNCAHFQSFSKQCGVFKRQVQLSNYAEFAPPKQRVKGRFLNLQYLANWAYNMLEILDLKTGLAPKIQYQLAWLKDYRSLVDDIYHQSLLMNKLFGVLKNKGLNNHTYEECLVLLETEQSTAIFRKQVKEYLTTNMTLLEERQSLICCSDIIESYFGKYKNIATKNGQSIITDACLCMANFSQKFDQNFVKMAMENTKIVDLQEWNNTNCSESIFKKKKALFKNTG